MSDQLYRLTYDVKVHKEGIPEKEIPSGRGACDAVFLTSIIYPEDGSLSFKFASVDGRTDKPVDFNEAFQIWTALAYSLSMRVDASPEKARFCANIHTIICSMLQAVTRAGKVKLTNSDLDVEIATEFLREGLGLILEDSPDEEKIQ